MAQTYAPGQIVILNGAPRSGKSSVAAAIQETFDGAWMNLGVDGFMRMTPARFMPGMGLRACYELGRKSHRNADFTVSVVPSRSLFPAFPRHF